MSASPSACKVKHPGPCSGPICPECKCCATWCKATACGWEDPEGYEAPAKAAQPASYTVEEQTFNLPWIPKPWQRAGTTLVKLKDGRQFIKHYTPKQTRHTEASIRDMLTQRGAKMYPAYEPLQLDIIFLVMKPPSATKKTRWPTKKPDLDNFEKSIMDSGTGILWPDDAQIVEKRTRKQFAEKPGVYIRVSVIPQLNAPALETGTLDLLFEELVA